MFEESVYIKEPILPPPPGKNNVEGEKEEEEEEAPTGPEAIEIEVENSDDEYEEEEGDELAIDYDSLNKERSKLETSRLQIQKKIRELDRK